MKLGLLLIAPIMYTNTADVVESKIQDQHQEAINEEFELIKSIKANKPFVAWLHEHPTIEREQLPQFLGTIQEQTGFNEKQMAWVEDFLQPRINHFARNRESRALRIDIDSDIDPFFVPSDGKTHDPGGPDGEGSGNYDFSQLAHDETPKIYNRFFGSQDTSMPFLYNEHQVELSGVTNEVDQHHDGFNSLVNLWDSDADTSDVTIFNWSNQTILEMVSESLINSELIQSQVRQLRRLETAEEFVDWAFQTATLPVTRALPTFATNGRIWNVIINRTNFLQNQFIKTLISRIPNMIVQTGLDYNRDQILERFEGIIPNNDDRPFYEKMLINGAESLFAITAMSIGGPVGAIMASALILMVDVMPTGNGYSMASNSHDHGLNDWRYQLENNFDNIAAIAASFSENFTHGISWRVEDSWSDTPNLWVRPGQSSDEPWVLVSDQYYNNYGRPRKSFVYGRPVDNPGFDSIANYRNMWASNGYDGQIIFEELGTVFSQGYNADFSNFRALTHNGVEYSGSDRYYSIEWIYRSRNGYRSAMSPDMCVHENDHDDDNSNKFTNYNAALPGEGIEVSSEDMLGDIVIEFEHEGNRVFRLSNAWNNLLHESYQTARRFTRDIIGGRNPNVPNGAEIFEEARNNPYLDIIPHIYFHGIHVGRTRFNTYNDHGWDNTHSDNFRFSGISISFNIKFEARSSAQWQG